MGEGYRSTDTTLKRQVAIKVLPAALAVDNACRSDCAGSDPGR
jgi:hypothetical protein